MCSIIPQPDSTSTQRILHLTYSSTNQNFHLQRGWGTKILFSINEWRTVHNRLRLLEETHGAKHFPISDNRWVGFYWNEPRLWIEERKFSKRAGKLMRVCIELVRGEELLELLDQSRLLLLVVANDRLEEATRLRRAAEATPEAGPLAAKRRRMCESSSASSTNETCCDCVLCRDNEHP